MNEERSIKVAFYGNPEGRMFNDKLSIEFSPSELSSLKILFTTLALSADDYDSQTKMREMREAFKRAYDVWEDYERVNK